jgi:hypothetical protein
MLLGSEQAETTNDMHLNLVVTASEVGAVVPELRR